MAGDIARKLRDLLTADVETAGFDLEEIVVSRAGARSVVRIVVDRDGGIDLDAVAVASRAISDVLDAHEDALPGAYALEVTSPGVDRPLTEPRHWRRNIGRQVKLTKTDGAELTGRITAAEESTVALDGMSIPLAEVSRGLVQVEFNRPKGEPDLADEYDEAAEATDES